MKALPWLLIVLLLGLLVMVWLQPHEKASSEVICDTIIVTDTVRDTVLKPVLTYIVDTLIVNVPLYTVKVEEDSVAIALPVERKEYKTDDYYAIISGFHSKLDFIETYNKKQTITIMPKLKRWGVGLQFGYGIYPGSSGFYGGIGLSYNLFQW